MVLATPVSWAMICCVRSAISAASSVGSAKASSIELVCRDWQPPSTAAKRLNGHAHDVVFGLLRGQRRAGGLRVEAQQQRARVAGVETLAHDARPQAAGRAVLGDLFEQIAVRVEEEGELRGEFVDAEASVDGGLDVGDGVGQREGDFLNRGRAGLANVIAGDGDGVPLGKFACGTRRRRP